MRVVLVAVAIAAALAAVLFLAASSTGDQSEAAEPEGVALLPSPDIVMPTKSSRPGCEEDDLCYIPPALDVRVGDTVTWTNQDAAFHSVTSGAYGEPDELFDSGYMDPGQSFSYLFEYSGTFEYYCTLHPWMEGTIQVMER